MKYSPAFFSRATPKWKKEKDPLICKLVYRPLSYGVASILAEVGITANQVSVFSIIVAVVSSILLGWNSHRITMAGAILLNIWLLLDCVDGTMARGLGPSPWGDYFDALGCYFLVAFLYFALGLSVYFQGGVVFAKKDLTIVLLGAITSIIDTLVRLIHHRYKEALEKQEGISVTKPENSTGKRLYLEHILESVGVGGMLPMAIVFTSALFANDLVVLFRLAITTCLLVFCIYKYIVSVIRLED